MIEAECLQGETEGLDIVEVFEEFPRLVQRESLFCDIGKEEPNAQRSRLSLEA